MDGDLQEVFEDELAAFGGLHEPPQSLPETLKPNQLDF